jgi:hypothetical protein
MLKFGTKGYLFLATTLALSGIVACASEDAFSDGTDWMPSGATVPKPSGSAAGTDEPTPVGQETGSATGSDAGPAAPSGLPCELKTMLTAKCATCHDGGSLSSVSTREALLAPSKTAGKNVAETSVARMQNAVRPMPPAGKLPDASIELLQNWIAAGYPSGTCAPAPSPADAGTDATSSTAVDSGTTTPPNPYATALVCTSGDTSAQPGSPNGMNMLPGRACLNCHGAGDFAGTVYPTAHEPTYCRGVDGTASATAAKIVITGADNKVYGPYPVSAFGNFKIPVGSIPLPYRAKVIRGSKERVMLSPMTNTDCNDCHTVNGRFGAPGRIMMP